MIAKLISKWIKLLGPEKSQATYPDLTKQVSRLLSSQANERQGALGFFLKQDVLFLEMGWLSHGKTFFVIDELHKLIILEDNALNLEVVQLFYEIVMNGNAFDCEYKEEDVNRILKRKLSPFNEKISTLEIQFDDSLILDLKLVKWFLERPADEWEFVPSGTNMDAIIECQKLRSLKT